MDNIPAEHIADAHSLSADGEIELFELTPNDGSGVIRFKTDNTVTWLTHEYTGGLPLQMTGEKKTSDSGLSMPKLVIGQPDFSIAIFKPLIYDGFLDNAVILKYTVLRDNLINNRSIFEVRTYRVKRVEEYSRSKVSLQLATLSDSLGFSMPYRTYTPPAFPSVQM